VVWSLLLQDESQGPTLIDYIVIANRVVRRRLALLMAHLESQFQSEL
jgi:hypothetical protein